MIAVGSECLEHADCVTGYCKAGRCALNAARKPCAAPTAACPAGSHCDPLTRHCQAPDWMPATGGICRADSDCPWGSFCTKFGRCTERFARDHPCKKDRQCGEGLACEQRACAERCLVDDNCHGSGKWECIKRPADALGVCRARLDIPPPPGLLPLWIVLSVALLLLVALFLLARLLWRWWRRRGRTTTLHLPVVRSSLPATPILIEEHHEQTPSQVEMVHPQPVQQHEANVWGGHRPEPVIKEEHHGAQTDAPRVGIVGLPGESTSSSAPGPVKFQDPTLPVWPEATIKLPDPFDEDIPHTPVERKEFSDPLNIAAPIHADERPPLVLPHDPSLESQSVWE